MDLNGKTAIVTGGANGIGLCIATCLLDNGVSVALLDKDKNKGEETKKQLQEKYGKKRVEYFICDVTNKDGFQGAVKEAVDRFSKLDIFVNNAGITKSDRWEDVIEINLIGTIRGAEEAAKYMSKEFGGDGGVIVNISSILGLLPFSKAPPYAASKHGVIGLTRALGCPEVYEASGIRHIAVCPGITDTDLAKRYTQEYIDIMAKALNINNIKQKPENVGACVLEAVKSAPTGSVWVAEDNEPGYEIAIPFYKTLKKSTADYFTPKYFFSFTSITLCSRGPHEYGHCIRIRRRVRITAYQRSILAMNLNGKTAIVTGGANGIGLSIATCLLDNGVKVALLDRDEQKGEGKKRELQDKYGKGKVEFFACNVADKDQFQGAVKEAVDKFSRLDIFVNNAGITISSRWEDVIEINLLGTMRGAEEAAKFMSKESGGEGGVIVNTASVAAFLPYPGAPPYCTSKYAIIAFTRSLGCPEVYEASGIRHVAVCPGFTDTDLVRKYSQEHIDEMAKKLKIGNIRQKPESVAACVLEAVKNAPTGSVWVSENNEPGYELSFPFYKTMRKTQL
ncbi:uncharacterized short-chain type dehydrogenase/reductase y4vI-like [Ischnura elegans]|uniref:uncharacterized short-chain type dehydrogenase/reductase y4vI-like n=1 Tax=Ischnura elegans TaxID=197161 RepID=UPI001ED86C01|nr:uncharacterized short-chain type dehydrogenase/reductase y4vI-like [Ischnura elegans]